MTNINIWAIIVASIVSFAISALWYSPVLFGKVWMTLTNMSASDMSEAQTRGLWKSYLVQFIFTLVSFSVLGFIIAAIGTVTASDGAFLGFVAWLGFIIPIGISSMLWERKSFKLFLINMVCTLITMSVGGAIMGAWH